MDGRGNRHPVSLRGAGRNGRSGGAKEYGRDLADVGRSGQAAPGEGPEAIDRELERIKPLIDDGGYIPMLDHSATPDTPYRSYCYFLEGLRKIL